MMAAGMRSRAQPQIGRRAARTTGRVHAAKALEAPVVKNSRIQKWQGEKRLQTQVLQIAKDTICIRSLDWDRDRFDIEFGLEKGTTYNSFLIFGEKVALVDASHEKFRELYMQTLKEQLREAGRGIDYIIATHTEPDHSGLIPDVLRLYPEATIVGSKVCTMFLQNLTHVEFKSNQVTSGKRLDLGNGHDIEFVSAPNLHWPDTIFSFDHGTGTMFTCDAFGMHYCTADPFDSNEDAILPHYRFYYDCLMKPNAKSVLNALKRIKDLKYNTIATGHGPLLRYNVEDLVDKYATWSAAVGSNPTSVAILYSSDYGFSDRLSQTLAKGVTKTGVQTEMVDLLSADPQELVMIVSRSKGVVLMAYPTDNAEAQASFAVLLSAIKAKSKVLVAESYGGNDEPVDTITSSLVDVGCDVVLESLRVKDTPTQQLYQQYEESGVRLAQALTKKETIQAVKSMPVDIAKSLARLSSGLYLVTAASNNARSAMVASWVSQASFEPLGLTIAVAKDRAIESLMQVGDKFVLNILGEQNYLPIMKHFLKRFKPGEDRFQGVDWFPAPNGSPVLQDSIAFMECKVVSRLDTPDHWVTYCEVEDGKVIRPDERTAVHRRKVANYY